MEAPGAGPGGTVLDRAWAAFDEGDDEPLWRLDPKSIMDQITVAQKL